jgi:hypothetical protein
MGSIAGPLIGAGASLIGGAQSASAAKKSAMIQAQAQDRAGERALTGYKYLTEGAGAAPMQGYINSGQRALGQQGTTQNLMMDLLGITGYGNSQGGGGGGGGAPAPAPAAPAGGGQPNAFAAPGGMPIAGGQGYQPIAGFDFSPANGGQWTPQQTPNNALGYYNPAYSGA